MNPTAPELETDVIEFLREAFADNYEMLKLEAGRGLSADGRRVAWNQVYLYWLKLSEIARSVTDTEVRLTLPNQRTAQGRPYAIEGVVDIVREEGSTVMYDIKSHDATFIRQNIDTYKQQLDVYAYIWQTLREEALDETAIIATHFPRAVADALASGDDDQLTRLLSQWDPVIPTAFDDSHIDDTVEEFGHVVDAIEGGAFGPRSVEDLDRREGLTQQRFATAVCRNCDARYSCASYRKWALSSSSHIEMAARQYFQDVDPEEDIEDWRTAGLDATPEPEELVQDFG